MAKSFAREKDAPYVRSVHGEGVAIISAHYIADLNAAPLEPWQRRGGPSGAAAGVRGA